MKQLRKILKNKGYIEVVKISQDDFGRFHAVLKKGDKKYFLKAISNDFEYGYESLKKESQVSNLISKASYQNRIVIENKRFFVPRVEEVFEDEGILCLISEYIEGIRLLDQNEKVKIQNIEATVKFVAEISSYLDKNELKPYLGNFSARKLIFFTPFRVVKAIALMPNKTIQLIKAGFNVAKILKRSNYKTGLVHADINASNIILKGKNVYLTDWEEAGWGVLEYNMTTPLCVQFELFSERNIRPYAPLFAFRVLSLLNQNVDKESKKRKRDLELLEYIQKL